MLEVIRGNDPAAERRAKRGAGTFADLAERYLEEHARKQNKSWWQAAKLVRKHLLPMWGKLDARSITRSDVRALVARIAGPVAANQSLAAASAIFSWAVRQELVPVNPCTGVERNPTQSRERVLSDAEVPLLWAALDEVGLMHGSALKLVLLTGQRPGEVAHMRREHISDGWWTLPGKPDPSTGWPGTKNGQTHRVWLPAAAQVIIARLTDEETSGFVFSADGRYAVCNLDKAMREACQALGIADKITPHDLRRTHGTRVTELGFGRDAMNRIQNHKEGGIGDIYDRHQYTEENKRVMEAVANRIMALAHGTAASTNVVILDRAKIAE